MHYCTKFFNFIIKFFNFIIKIVVERSRREGLGTRLRREEIQALCGLREPDVEHDNEEHRGRPCPPGGEGEGDPAIAEHT